jgi:hypothetical protein
MCVDLTEIIRLFSFLARSFKVLVLLEILFEFLEESRVAPFAQQTFLVQEGDDTGLDKQVTEYKPHTATQGRK